MEVNLVNLTSLILDFGEDNILDEGVIKIGESLDYLTELIELYLDFVDTGITNTGFEEILDDLK